MPTMAENSIAELHRRKPHIRTGGYEAAIRSDSNPAVFEFDLRYQPRQVDRAMPSSHKDSARWHIWMHPNVDDAASLH
jgi:hypothetical protein